MKISNNMSESFFAWQVRAMRIGAVLFLIAAVVFRRHFIDLAGCAVVTFLAAALAARRRANFLLEVFDFGAYFKLRLDHDEAILQLSNIDKVDVRDGKDGLDWINMTLFQDSRFGKCIRFYPDMIRMPMGRVDLWVMQMNERIAAARRN
jgi:hypothetical protein